MELTIAYHKLMTYNKKCTYIMKDGQIVFNNGWAWIVVFQALNKRNFAIVKYYNGSYQLVEFQKITIFRKIDIKIFDFYNKMCYTCLNNKNY